MKKFVLLMLIVILCASCSDKEEITVSFEGYVKTLDVTDTTTTSATCKGNVQILIDKNVPPIYEYSVSPHKYIEESGICYSRANNPTIGDNKKIGNRIIEQINGHIIILNPKVGEFTANLTGLQPNTTYYVRAYTKTSVGLFYGNEISFKTKNVTIEKDYIELTTAGIAVQKYDISKSTDHNSAAILCSQSKTGGFNDWRLPELSELSVLYTYKDVIGGFENGYNGSKYWSSTPYEAWGADGWYYYDFWSNGYQGNANATELFCVRCVRDIAAK
jgi:hypothetical protein